MNFEDRLNLRLSLLKESNDEELLRRLDELAKEREEHWETDDPRITGWDLIGIEDPGSFSIRFESQHPRDAFVTDIHGLRKFFEHNVKHDTEIKKVPYKHGEMWRLDMKKYPEYVFINKRID